MSRRDDSPGGSPGYPSRGKRVVTDPLQADGNFADARDLRNQLRAQEDNSSESGRSAGSVGRMRDRDDTPSSGSGSAKRRNLRSDASSSAIANNDGSFMGRMGNLEARSDGTPGSEVSKPDRPEKAMMPPTPKSISSLEKEQRQLNAPSMSSGSTPFAMPTPGTDMFASMMQGMKTGAKGQFEPGHTPFVGGDYMGQAAFEQVRFPNAGFMDAQVRREEDALGNKFIWLLEPMNNGNPLLSTRIPPSRVFFPRTTAVDAIEFYVSGLFRESTPNCTEVDQWSYRMVCLNLYGSMLTTRYKQRYANQMHGLEAVRIKVGKIEEYPIPPGQKNKWEEGMCDPSGNEMTKEQWKQVRQMLTRWKSENDMYRQGSHQVQRSANPFDMPMDQMQKDDGDVQAVVTQNLCKGAIRRLARRGGIRRISGKIYKDVRYSFQTWLEKVLEQTNILVQHQNRRTVRPIDIVRALKLQGRSIYGYGQ